MNSQWRPNGWKNPHSNMGQRTNNHRKYDAYEAGASAMIVAIVAQIKKHSELVEPDKDSMTQFAPFYQVDKQLLEG